MTHYTKQELKNHTLSQYCEKLFEIRPVISVLDIVCVNAPSFYKLHFLLKTHNLMMEETVKFGLSVDKSPLRGTVQNCIDVNAFEDALYAMYSSKECVSLMLSNLVEKLMKMES